MQADLEARATRLGAEQVRIAATPDQVAPNCSAAPSRGLALQRLALHFFRWQHPPLRPAKSAHQHRSAPTGCRCAIHAP